MMSVCSKLSRNIVKHTTSASSSVKTESIYAETVCSKFLRDTFEYTLTIKTVTTLSYDRPVKSDENIIILPIFFEISKMIT